MNQEMIPLLVGGLGLLMAFVIFLMVNKMPAGEGKVKEIAQEIHEGAMVFMRREYTLLLLFVVVIVIGLYVGFGDWHTPFAFILGALCSGIAGYFGMFSATKANVCLWLFTAVPSWV